MEPTFKTSFIPKKPIATAQASGPAPARSFNFFSLISTTIFIITILASGGLFAYKKILENQIVKADKDVNEARAAFQVEEIKDLIDANSRITAINSLLKNHVVLSKVFTLLEELTIKKIRFSDFSYAKKGDSLTLKMKTESQNYSALASQEEIFSKSQFLKNTKFFDFNIGENGYITTDFFTELNPSLISYKSVVESVSGNEQ
ncbi:MAG: hypothetical protein A3H52_01075 [Candidatus Zambryskibacteria bacterium RIFCSPLOWO2_02_FULL_39_26]|nr:MAG: hypothetical protein A3E59_02485 [Candidatus Zambryskibacteria bacterium RIFCSPHIGHO2_12_FULL_39_47]OHB09986.1 MAG: hypothetical protein A3H52_01075 [Candidatus Zambryskibacteria bacterium RIFCSPLOWO2_02_FULL_39_26]